MPSEELPANNTLHRHYPWDEINTVGARITPFALYGETVDDRPIHNVKETTAFVAHLIMLFVVLTASTWLWAKIKDIKATQIKNCALAYAVAAACVILYDAMRYPTLFAMHGVKTDGWCLGFQTMDMWVNSFEKVVIMTYVP